MRFPSLWCVHRDKAFVTERVYLRQACANIV
jgi:hypothetical protein